MPTRQSGDKKYYELLSRIPKSVTAEIAKQYRDSDSRLDDPAHTDLGSALTRICNTLSHPKVLDLGCGCGRQFRFLQGAETIVGVDVSTEMLKQAEHPAGEEQISAKVELICGDVFNLNFPDNSFDLIYSCGLFGLWVPLDDFILKKISRWLKPGGAAFLVIIDASSPRTTTWKGRLASSLRKFLPNPVRRYLDARPGSMFLKLYESELRNLMAGANFDFTIWQRGNPARRIDLVCEARKPESGKLGTESN